MKVVDTTTRISIPNRQTPVLLLFVPVWKDNDAIKSRHRVRGVKCFISPRINPKRRGTRVTRLDVSYYVGTDHVAVGCTCCRVKLLERNQSTCYRWEGAHNGRVQRPRRCYWCNTVGLLVGACSGLVKPREKLSLSSNMRKEATQNSEIYIWLLLFEIIEDG